MRSSNARDSLTVMVLLKFISKMTCQAFNDIAPRIAEELPLGLRNWCRRWEYLR